MSDPTQVDLAAVMHDHDHEAPTTDDLLAALRGDSTRPVPPVPGRWRRRWVPLAAAAAVAAVIAGSVWAGYQVAGRRVPAGQPQPLSCPGRYAGTAPWVPAKPAGLSGRARLAPRRVPRSAVICAYDGSNIGPAPGWALSGRRVLAGGLGALAAQLSWQPVGQPVFCTLVGGRQVNYLIGLTYPGGGRLWVAATKDPNDCVKSSNGEFVSIGVIGPSVARAFGTGRWPHRRPTSCHGMGPGMGRLGQGMAMVPPGATSVTICGRGALTIASGTPGYQRLADALNALPASRSTRSCTQVPGRSGPRYRLLFSYPAGPDVQVSVDSGCSPPIDNLGLQSASARTIVPIIAALLRRLTG